MKLQMQNVSEYYYKLAIKYFVFAFATICILISLFEMHSRYNIAQSGISEVGTVYEIEHASNAEMECLVFKVKFKYKGEDYFIHNDNMTMDDRYKINEKLKVMFTVDSPEKAIIDDSRENGYPIMFFAGLAVLAVAVFFTVKDKKEAAAQN